MNPTAIYGTTSTAVVAGDGIPLHFGNITDEYSAALERAVIMDRSHEGHFELSGRDRLAIPHRISTNDLLTLAPGEVRPTIFTNATARILDRALFIDRGERVLVITEPGRGEALQRYIQRNIFFNDEAHIHNLAGTMRQFVLHGPNADAVAQQFAPELAPMHGESVQISGVEVFIIRDKPISGSHWRMLVPSEKADNIWAAFVAAGTEYGLIPAGSLTYNALRIRAGRPGAERELSTEYIPLEVGLWDEISFTKGCYTGQEIIARMESRGKLAKTIVRLRLQSMVEAPAPIRLDGREIGTLSSSVQTPNGDLLGIGVLKVAAALPGSHVAVAEGIDAEIIALAGVQPGETNGG